jgi:hypothetical protein
MMELPKRHSTGGPSPSAWLTPKGAQVDSELRGTTNNRLGQAIPALVGSNFKFSPDSLRPDSDLRFKVGIQKETCFFKWEVRVSRCAIVGEHADCGAGTRRGTGLVCTLGRLGSSGGRPGPRLRLAGALHASGPWPPPLRGSLRSRHGRVTAGPGRFSSTQAPTPVGRLRESESGPRRARNFRCPWRPPPAGWLPAG